MSSQNWKEKLSFLDPKYITRKIRDEDVKFYPISINVAFRLREPLKTLASAFATLMAGGSNDVAVKDTQFGKEGDADSGRTIVSEAITPELAECRLEQKQRAAVNIVESLISDENKIVLGEIIMDSMLEIFPRPTGSGPSDNPPVEVFVDSLDAPAIVELLQGVLEANKGMFGPLVSQMETALEGLKENVAEKLKLTKDEDD